MQEILSAAGPLSRTPLARATPLLSGLAADPPPPVHFTQIQTLDGLGSIVTSLSVCLSVPGTRVLGSTRLN